MASCDYLSPGFMKRNGTNTIKSLHLLLYRRIISMFVSKIRAKEPNQLEGTLDKKSKAAEIRFEEPL